VSGPHVGDQPAVDGDGGAGPDVLAGVEVGGDRLSDPFEAGLAHVPSTRCAVIPTPPVDHGGPRRFHSMAPGYRGATRPGKEDAGP
jgi:hypothetical protein